MAGKHTGELAAEAVARKKKHTPSPHGTRPSGAHVGDGVGEEAMDAMMATMSPAAMAAMMAMMADDAADTPIRK